MSDNLIGYLLGGKYKIVRHLGRGGMAEVYLAYQENLERNVAIKVMHAFLLAEQDFLQRFKREARAMAAMNHPNIVAVYDFDVFGENSYYLVMEYIGGGTLKEKLTELAQNNERLPLEETVKIVQEVANALAYAHNRGMIHRDVKPANIMLHESGRAVLTDFGIVKLVGGQSMAYTATGALIGTPAYMSPEQALGKPGDARADIYSLGVLLFQMATGKLPFDGDTPLAVVMKHVNEPTPLPISFNPDVPLELQEIILKAMAKDPQERYQSAAELAAALRAVDLSAPAATLSAVPAGSVPTMSPPTSRVTVPGVGESTASEVTAATTDTTAGNTAANLEMKPAAATLPGKKSSFRMYSILGFLVVLLIGGGLFALLRRQPEPAEQPTALLVSVSADETGTPPAPTFTIAAAQPGETRETPDVVASAVAAIEQTRQAQPTATTSPTNTPTATPSPTPDLTAAFIETCVTDAELVALYTFRNHRFTSAPVEANFPIDWVLRNSGTCPWPGGLSWAYQEGEAFGFDGPPIPLPPAVTAGQTITLTANLAAPHNPGTYESTWQLVDGNGQLFGPSLTFEIDIYVPPTPTPIPPTATATAAATPTRALEELNYIFTVGTCEYVGSDWRCAVTITPHGGAGGPYTVFVFDQPAGQATTFRGAGPFIYFAQARRCANFNSGVRVVDDGVTPSLEMNRPLFLDPDNYIEGGCTQ